MNFVIIASDLVAQTFTDALKKLVEVKLYALASRDINKAIVFLNTHYGIRRVWGLKYPQEIYD